MTNRIVGALEHSATKLGKTLGEDAGKAVKDLYHSTGHNLTGIAEDTAAADAKHAKSLRDLLRDGKDETPTAPHAPGEEGHLPHGDAHEPPLGGEHAPGQPSEGNGGCTTGGDPVDVVSGQMITSATDVDLPGLLPLVLRRAYASGYAGGRWFGPGWSGTLDQRVQIDADGIRYAGEDAEIQTYPLPTPERPCVLPEFGAQRPLTWDRDDGEDTVRIEDTATGWTRHFAAPEGRPGARTRTITALTDRNGHRIEYVPGPDGLPAEVRHCGGYRVAVDTIGTPAGPRISGLRLLDGDGDTTEGTPLVRYAYDDHGRLTEITDSTGLPLTYAYDARDRITSWTDRNRHWYAYEYGPDGRVTHGHGPQGALEAHFTYDVAGRTTTVTNSLGARTTYHYDGHHHLTRTVDPRGGTVHTEHDRSGWLTSHTDELGHTTRYTLNANGDPVRIERPDGTHLSLRYNALFLPVRVEAQDGTTWRFEYDAKGNLLTSTDPAGAVTTNAYDERGNRLSRTDALGGKVRYRTDAAGLPVQVTTMLGGTVVVERDAFGRAVAITDPVGGTVRQRWNVEGDLLWQSAANGSQQEWVYDPERNLIEHCHQTGHRTQFSYGPFGMPRLRVDPDGTRYEFTHDTELHLTAVTSPRSLSWRYIYDETGCLISETDFNGRTLHYRGDAAGRLSERVNGAGQSVSYTRDAIGRVVASRTGDGAETTYGYDSAGRLARAAATDSLVEYTYDAVGRVIAESIDGRLLANQYDLLGRRTRRITPTGVVSEWTYDAAGLPMTLATTGGVLSFQHDAAGREITRLIGDRAAMTQIWDAAHQLAGQAIWSRDDVATESGSSARQVQARTYTYRADGQPTEITDRLDGTRRFGLDPAGRVLTVRAATWTETYAYNSAGNVAHAAYPDVDDEAQGARDHSGTLIRRAGRTTYEHDAQGRVVTALRRTLSGRTRTQRYTWDAEDRLVQAATPDGAVWRYRYDALGRRVAKIRVSADGTPEEQVLFSWDGPNLVEQRTVRPGSDTETTVTWDWEPGTHRPATQLNRTVYSGGTDLGMPQSEVDRRFHAIVTDLIGTPRELVALDGTIAWRGSTTLWGSPVGSPARQLDCPLRFPGQYHDAETGLHYNLARYYDADTAAYLSPDPLGLEPAPNPHAYVPNPLLWSDPLGLSPLWTPVDYNGQRIYQRDDLINPGYFSPLDNHGRSNLKRMTQGLAPMGPDDKPVNLHHMLQTQDGPVAEVTQSMHLAQGDYTGSGSYNTLHWKAGTNIPSGIDRPAFKAWKEQYWKDRAKVLQGGCGT